MKIKFLCLNVWEGGKLMDPILEFIRIEAPDIVALQEVYDGRERSWNAQYRTMQHFQEQLCELAHSHFAPAFLEVLDFGKINQGNAIFSKFPISDSNIIFGDVPYGQRSLGKDDLHFTPRNLQHVALDVHGCEVNLFNTQGIWGRDGDDNARRLALSEMIVTQIRDKPNVILCGDFNVQMKTKSIANIEHHLHNVFQDTLTSSFNMRRKSDPCFATAVVDAIFVSPSIDILHSTAPDVDISDHLPLLASLELST